MQARCRLALVGGVLGRQAVELRHAELLELAKMIAERARLRRAAARAWNLVPAIGWIDTRHARSRVHVNNGAPFKLRQVDRCAVRRRQSQVGQLGPREMARSAVILRCRNARGQKLRIMRARRFGHFLSPFQPVYDINSMSEPSGSRK